MQTGACVRLSERERERGRESARESMCCARSLQPRAGVQGRSLSSRWRAATLAARLATPWSLRHLWI